MDPSERVAQRRALQSRSRNRANARVGNDGAAGAYANWEIERRHDQLVLRQKAAAVKDEDRARVFGVLGLCGFLVFLVVVIAAMFRWPVQVLLAIALLLLVGALGFTVPFLVRQAWRGRAVTLVFDRDQDAVYRNGTRVETLSLLLGVGIRRHQSDASAWYTLGVRFRRGLSRVNWLDIDRGDKSALIPLGETIATFVGGRLEMPDE